MDVKNISFELILVLEELGNVPQSVENYSITYFKSNVHVHIHATFSATKSLMVSTKRSFRNVHIIIFTCTCMYYFGLETCIVI